MYDGVFEIDDEDEDSDAYIENQVAKIAKNLKTQIETKKQEKEEDSENMDYLDDDFD